MGASLYVCPFTTTEFASARNIKLAAPTFSLAVGDSMTTVYEFQDVNWSTRPTALQLTVPSFFSKFPLANGTDLTSYFTPRTITISNGSWTSASLATKTKVMTASTVFSGANAFMTSELVAIMGNASYQSVSVAFRWDWTVTFASNLSSVTSVWSRVVTGGANPTTFYPAPTVQLASTSNKTAVIGTTFTGYLTGAISQTAFHSVLEYAATGNVIRNTPTYTSLGNSSPDAVAVRIMPTSGPMSPTTLLDHVRNICGALLFSISVKAIYASSANITFQVVPSTCGPVIYNGTSYGNGSTLSSVPSAALLGLSLGSCSGHTFQGWNFTGGLWVTSSHSSSTTATLSASGTVTARFV